MSQEVTRDIKSLLNVLDTIIQEVQGILYIFVQLLVEKEKMEKLSL